MVRADSPADTATEPDVQLKASGQVAAEKDIEATTVRHTHPRAHELDIGDDSVRYRRRWYQIWLPRDPPPPPPKSLDDSSISPLTTANILSKMTYHWITPIMTLGFQRPLQATDLWRMDPSREAEYLSSRLDDAWSRRVARAKDRNTRLADGEIDPSLVRRSWWAIKSVFGGGSQTTQEERWRSVDGRVDPSLVWALNDVLGISFWAGGAHLRPMRQFRLLIAPELLGLFKVVGDVSQLMVPIISKSLINFGKERAAAKAAGQEPPNIGRGIGMAFGVGLLTIVYSVTAHQWLWRSMSAGVLARCALISSLYKRGVKLSTKARSIHSNAALVNHMSTDISRIDYAAQWFHAVWTAPIQVLVCLVLLLIQLGPSALAGFAVFVMLVPLQKQFMTHQLGIRRKSMKWTDERAGLLQELLSAMRIIKYFCYEVPFLERIDHIRHEELQGVSRILIIKAANQAIAFSVPALASVLAFVVYALAGHDLDPAIVFTSLSLFQLLRQPLMLFPRAVSSYTDAESAFARLTPVWHAETLDGATRIDPASEFAVHVQDADFQWEAPPPPTASQQKSKKHRLAKSLHRHDKSNTGTGVNTPMPVHEPFALRGVSLSIPKGQLCAIAGPVGSGKSSLLLALLGEMKQLRGDKPVFGGSMAYCAQMAWIQNASVRENILFGTDFDEERYWKAVQNASLLSDLEMLPDGDLTEIGEKGINLSGGQKQRVNIARALYHDADIVILDDPLSAVDAHVGEALFNEAIIGNLKNRGKTVILVTHALHFLHHVDYIYNIVDGVIVEQGTYDELVGNGQAFSRLLHEFSGKQQHSEVDDGDVETAKKDKKVTLGEVKRKLDLKNLGKAAGSGKIEGRLLKAEKRSTGSIDKGVYVTYMKAGKGYIVIPLILLTCILMQGSQVLNSYWLIWWQENSFNRSTRFYMVLYAVLGVSQAVFTFLLGVTMSILSFYACKSLHKQGTHKVFHATMSFFDTTPLGRILGVFGKDIDTIDNVLPDALRMFILSIANALGSIIIITYLLYYFVVVAAVICLAYWYFSAYYGYSARELKRLDGSLRSLLYSHFAESLSGLSTIRAYGEVDRFLRENEYFNDLEDRALFLTVTNQRWLAIRLDFMGAILIFVVAIMAAADVGGVNPAQIGLVLVYCVSLTQTFSQVTRQAAEVENNMNAVERIVHYTQDDYIEQETPHIIDNNRPPPEWPNNGALQFRDVIMKYRPSLPPVLKGITMEIKGGEKIGVVGRTGAGKSSLMIALYRIVELSGGSISLDGIDISTIGLRDLRSKISIIPQDPLLFSGTVRSNLDPFSHYDDAKLYDALRRSHLGAALPSNNDATEGEGVSERPLPVSKFNLDTPVEAEGANLSVGERSLLSLARALVRDEIKVVIMDEATASVDVETDGAIQETISKEFGGKTLLCIAHRLRTVIRYDRVLVLDSGKIAELDTPYNLFKKEDGIFRSLCEQSKITEEDFTV
ncbi:hypothetical protein FRC04_011552 [Tulasnella sp. 424]|nr:hypothetical protein FRC04_011552 [Tulasnella sp. 424]KAG8971629.1 hypothetical protein FRC05_010885 [Tulasnella sp. 425]